LGQGRLLTYFNNKIMIERHWKGLAKFDEAKNYEHHLKTETFVKLATIPGFVSEKILKRALAGGIEFLIITTWESIAVIKQFAGEDIEIAVVPAKVRDMMIAFDETAAHYEIAE
jgi:heme-degrading monooxygenase HmoA